MDLIYIKLGDVVDTTGRSMSACIRKASMGDTSKYVVAFGDSRREEFCLSTVIEAAVRDEAAPFIVADLWDGHTDYVIPTSEIRKLAQQILSPCLIESGRFEVEVNFTPCDPNCPF